MKQANVLTRIKPYTTLEMARFYGITEKTMRAWIIPYEKEIGAKRGHYWNPKQIEAMVAVFGMPHDIVQEDTARGGK